MSERTRLKKQPTAVESTVTVQTTIMRNAPVDDTENSEMVTDDVITNIHKFVTDPAYVNVKAGMTKSLGEGTYEFLRVDVGISMPCYKEQVDEQFSEVADMVADRLGSEVENYLG